MRQGAHVRLRRDGIALGVLAAAYLVAAMLVTNSYYQLILTLVPIWAVFGVSWNILSGYGGQLSFGHASFFGIGAYTVTLALVYWDLTPWLGIPLGAVLGAVAAVVIGTPTFRLRGHYFALAMLAYPLFILYLLQYLGFQEVSLPMHRENPAAYLEFADQRLYTVVAIGLLVGGLIVCMLVENSRFGLALMAIRQNELAAEAAGINARRWKMRALMTSGVIAASAVALYAMLGVESAALPAGRVRDPARTIPRATFIGTLVVAVICCCVSLLPIVLIPQGELAASNAPFADLFTRFLGSGSGKVLAAFVIVSGLGCLNGWTLILGEITVSFARHGAFPQALGKVNSHGAPTLAFVVTGLFASIMMISSYNDSMAGAFTFLSVVVTAANVPLYLGCALAVLVLWQRGKIPHPGARELRWVAAAFIATVYCVWVSIGFGGKSLLWAAALCAVGLPVYWWYAYVRRDAITARA